jgi:hypothetical protein
LGSAKLQEASKCCSQPSKCFLNVSLNKKLVSYSSVYQNTKQLLFTTNFNWVPPLLTFLRTSCFFSPDEKLIGTGTSVRKGQVVILTFCIELFLMRTNNNCPFNIFQGNGKLVFYEKSTFKKVHEYSVTDSVSFYLFIFP